MRRSPRERRAVNIQSAAMRRAVNIQNAAADRVLPHRKNPAMIRGSINLTNRAAAPPLSNSQINLKASLKKKLRRYSCVGQTRVITESRGPLLHKPVQDEQLTEICRAHSGGDAA